MYSLYSFDQNYLQDGYKFEGFFESEQDCNQAAFELGVNFFRVELDTSFGSTIIFESIHE